jgi:hypothetical protein
MASRTASDPALQIIPNFHPKFLWPCDLFYSSTFGTWAAPEEIFVEFTFLDHPDVEINRVFQQNAVFR